MLTVVDLNLGFQNSREFVHTLFDINFSLERGKTLAIVGESGSGKSLTCFSILKLLPSNCQFLKHGQIYFEGQDLIDTSEKQMQQIRGKKIAIIFQEPMTALNPVKSIGHQLLEISSSKSAIWQILEEVGLDAKRVFYAYPHELSGGMKQRVVIAMALIANPDIIIADEPTSALDVTVQAQILELLKKLQQKRQLAMIFVSHDLHVVAKIADNIAVMYAGQIVEFAKAKDFFSDPKHPYSIKLLSCLPKLELPQDKLPTILGTVPSPGTMFTGCHFSERCDFKEKICFEKKPNFHNIKENHIVKCFGYVDDILKEKLVLLSSKKNTNLIEKKEIKNNYESFNHNKDSSLNEDNKFNEDNSYNKDNNYLLEINNLYVCFYLKKNKLFEKRKKFTAIKDLSLLIKKGHTLAVVGESGSGKTSLAKTVLRLINHDKGSIIFNKKDISSLSYTELKSIRKKIQIVFQDPFSSMNPRMMVADILSEGIDALKLYKDYKTKEKKLIELLDLIGLPKTSLTRFPHEFSGGQRQRLAIARALAVDPELLILDEPTSALDVSVQAQILNLFKELQKEKNLTYLFISHNLAAVSYLATEIAVMKQGEIIEQGSCQQILFHPQHSYTKRLIESIKIYQ